MNAGDHRMSVDVRTFKADSMQAALDLVRRELGADAVILHTKQVDKRRGWLWSRKQSEVEITASSQVNVQPILTAAKKAVSETAASASTRRGNSAVDDNLAPPPPLLSGATTSRLPSETTAPKNNVVPPKWSPNDVIRDEPVRTTPPKRSTPPVKTPSAASRAPLPPALSQTIAARSRKIDSSELTSRSAPRLAPSEPPLVTAVSGGIDLTQRPATTPADLSTVQQRLETLQKMILDLGRERRGSSLHDVPPELFQLYTTLLDTEVDDELARELVCRAKQHASKSQLADPSATMALLSVLIEQELRVASPIVPVKGRRKVIALVGPTGVGKTTTLAKLAANFRLRDGAKIGLVTVDTYRIAAVEQLRTYAEIIDLPMKVVTTPGEMRQAMDELRGMDLVLIDTAGRSPKDEPQIRELKAFLDEARADEIHLVLSLASSLKSLETVAANFQSIGLTSLVLTKLDEALGAGSLLNVARRLKTPISYLTTGQDVPDDIEPAQKTRMARLILGLDNVGSHRDRALMMTSRQRMVSAT